MLGKIEQISNRAQTAIEQKLDQLAQNSTEYRDLIHLKNAYTQLNALIKAVSDQRATVGAYILAGQLSQNESGLNAAQLLKNFIKVLEYRVETTFSLNQRPEQQSNIDAAKMFSLLPVMFLVVLYATFPPMLIMSFKPALILLISALPLAITYAYDAPFSVARFYQEMAGIEKALAYAVLGTMFLLVAIAFSAEVTMLSVGIAFLGMASTGLAFLLHSKHLQSKHDHLKEDTRRIRSVVYPSTYHAPSLIFFKAQASAGSQDSPASYLQEIDQTLSCITACN